MSRRVVVELELSARQTLEAMRDHHPKAHLRQRAAAVLKVADGMQIKQVAATGLLSQRDAETVGRWVQRYQALGVVGLYDRPGRGRKPAFFPPGS